MWYLIIGIVFFLIGLYMIIKSFNKIEDNYYENLENIMQGFEAGRKLDRNNFEEQDWNDWTNFINELD